MDEFIFHGILINDNTCKIPPARMVGMIADIIGFIKGEQNVAKALQDNAETLTIFEKSNSDNLIIVHTHNGNISLSKLDANNNPNNITDMDILDISEKDQLYRLSRITNRTIGAFQRGELSLRTVVAPTVLVKIREKDSSDQNIHHVSKLNLEESKRIIKSDDELDDSLKSFSKSHDIDDMTKELKKFQTRLNT